MNDAPFDPVTGEIRHGTVTTSAAIDQLADALAKAQAQIENVTKDAENPHFRSKYADLGSILAEARPKLAAAGIALVQSPYVEGENVGVETLLLHKSGQWLRGTIAVKPMKFDAQGAGGVITYLRRYALAAIAAVGSEDDDGEAAVGRPAEKRQAPPQRPAESDQRAKAQAAYEAVIADLRGAKDAAQIDAIMAAHTDDLVLVGEFSPTAGEKLTTAAAKRRAVLSKPAPSDEIAP